jgi:hypothetical protein
MSVIAAIQQMSQAELPDALDVLHQRYGRYALNEFLRETEAYRTTVKITLDGRDSYTLSLPYGTSPLHIKSVFRDDHRLTLSGDPAKVRLDGRKLLVDPTLTGVLAVELSLNVSPLDGDVDFEVLESWLEALVAGTLSRLYSMKMYHWADMNAAAMHRAVFDNGVISARQEAKRLMSNRPMVVAYGGI